MRIRRNVRNGTRWIITRCIITMCRSQPPFLYSYRRVEKTRILPLPVEFPRRISSIELSKLKFFFSFFFLIRRLETSKSNFIGPCWIVWNFRREGTKRETAERLVERFYYASSSTTNGIRMKSDRFFNEDISRKVWGKRKTKKKKEFRSSIRDCARARVRKRV